MTGPLVTSAWLRDRLGEPGLQVVDCRYQLGKPGAGEVLWRAGHIPGAAFLDVDRDLAGPPGERGRHPLPDAEAFQAAARRAGIGQDTLVVAYDEAAEGGAARLWWLLRHFGHENVTVLDGGLRGWREEGGELRRGTEEIEPGNFHARPPAGATASIEELARTLRDMGATSAGQTGATSAGETAETSARDTGATSARDTGLTSARDTGATPARDTDAAPGSGARGAPVLLDARAPERYRGEVEPIDPVAGHIPGAVSMPFAGLAPEGRFLPPAELRARFEAAGVASGDEGVAYCGSGVTACVLVLAAEVAGIGPARLYPGSWSEWSGRGLPVERG